MSEPSPPRQPSKPSQPSPPSEPAPGAWQHLHPLSPVLRGGVALVGLVGYVATQQFNSLVGAQADDPTQGHRMIAVAVVAALAVLLVGGSWVSWRVSRFRIGTHDVELRTGLLFRQHRQVPFDRIQAVDLSRPVLARLTGLSEVVVRSAGGRESHLKLAFLADAQAQELRERLMVLAGKADEARVADPAAGPVDRGLDGTDPTTQTARSGSLGWSSSSGSSVVRVPNLRLVQASLYSGGAVFVVVALVAIAVGTALGAPGAVGFLWPLVLGVGGRHLRGLVREANFTIDHRGDRLVIRRGLAELRSITVPLHRIQAAGLVQPMWWRLPGWWRLQVNVAGVPGGDEARSETVLLPVGTLGEALAVLALVRPGLPEPTVVAALTGRGENHGFTTASVRARVLDPLSWSRRGYAVTPDAVVVRGGVVRRSAEVVPHARVQSLAVRQGPIQRWRGVADVAFASTPGPVRVRADHLDLAVAERLLDEQRGRSHRARRTSEA